LGDDLQLVGGHALGMPEFWTIAGRAGTGKIFTGRRDTGLGAATAGAIDALRAHGVEPVPGNLAAYAAVEVWAQAVERAGSPAPAGVTKALQDGRFATVLGWIGFDGKGDLEGGDWQWQVWREDGAYELLKPAMAQIK
jgi:branched-chain amino acid transport system substrate-binding protein